MERLPGPSKTSHPTGAQSMNPPLTHQLSKNSAPMITHCTFSHLKQTINKNSARSYILLCHFSVLFCGKAFARADFSLGPQTGFHWYHIIETTPEKAIKNAQDLHATKSRSPFSGPPWRFLRTRDRAHGSFWSSFTLSSPATCSWFSPISPAAPSVFLWTCSLRDL